MVVSDPKLKILLKMFYFLAKNSVAPSVVIRVTAFLITSFLKLIVIFKIPGIKRNMVMQQKWT